MIEPIAGDSCDKHFKRRIQKEDTIEHETSIDINDENSVVSQNYYENVIFGSHDGSVYCVTNLGKLLWKIDVESPVYSTPFSGLITIRGKGNDHPNTNCLKKDKLAEISGDEPNILVDQNSIVESDEREIVIGDKCFNPNTFKMVKTPQSFDHSECIMVDGAENIVHEPSIANEQNHENDLKEIDEGGKSVIDNNEFRKTDVKSEADNENQTTDVKNDTIDNEYQNISVTTEDIDKQYQFINAVDKGYQTINIKSKEDQKTDVETYFVDNVHLNSFLTNEHKDNKHWISDIKTEDVGNMHQNMDVKSESVNQNICVRQKAVDQNIGVRQKAVDQNIGVRQKDVDQNIGVKSNIADASNVSNSDMEKTQSVAIITFATTIGILYVVGAEDGQVLCKTQMEGEVFSSPILYRNSLVVGCRDDNVYCFDIDAG